MSTFPTLSPAEISFDHGLANVSEYNSFGLGAIRFRHSNFVNGQVLNLTFQHLTQTQVDLIRDHYQAVGGSHGSFAVPSSVWGGANLHYQTSRYRYAETPEEEHTGVFFNVTVSLRSIEGIQPVLTLNGGNQYVADEETVNTFALSGTSPFKLVGSTSAVATLILDASNI